MAEPTDAFRTIDDDAGLGALKRDDRAAFVIDRAGRRLLWANAAGFALFGAQSRAALDAVDLARVSPSAARLAALAPTLSGRPRLERLRLVAGFRGAAITCQVSPLQVGGDKAVLVLALDGPRLPGTAEVQAARYAALSGTPASALTAGVGSVAASAPAGDAAGDGLEPTDSSAAGSATDDTVDAPAPGLTAGADAAEDVAAVAEEAGAADIGDATTPTGGTEEAEAASPAGAATAAGDAGTLPQIAGEAVTASAGEAPLDLAADSGTVSADETVFADEEPGEMADDAASSPPEDGAAPDPAPDVAAAAEPFRFAADEGVVRFVFELDDGDRFGFVSPSVAGTVGPLAAPAIGEPWAALADRLGLDPAGRVAGALARRDTFTSTEVRWPVQDTPLRLPVGLTGMPVFGRDRRFKGYRGFGVCRPAEAEAADAVVVSSRPAVPAEAFEAEAAAAATAVATETPAAAERPSADDGLAPSEASAVFEAPMATEAAVVHAAPTAGESRAGDETLATETFESEMRAPLSEPAGAAPVEDAPMAAATMPAISATSAVALLASESAVHGAPMARAVSEPASAAPAADAGDVDAATATVDEQTNLSTGTELAPDTDVADVAGNAEDEAATAGAADESGGAEAQTPLSPAAADAGETDGQAAASGTPADVTGIADDAGIAEDGEPNIEAPVSSGVEADARDAGDSAGERDGETAASIETVDTAGDMPAALADPAATSAVDEAGPAAEAGRSEADEVSAREVAPPLAAEPVSPVGAGDEGSATPAEEVVAGADSGGEDGAPRPGADVPSISQTPGFFIGSMPLRADDGTTAASDAAEMPAAGPAVATVSLEGAEPDGAGPEVGALRPSDAAEPAEEPRPGETTATATHGGPQDDAANEVAAEATADREPSDRSETPAAAGNDVDTAVVADLPDEAAAEISQAPAGSAAEGPTQDRAAGSDAADEAGRPATAEGTPAAEPPADGGRSGAEIVASPVIARPLPVEARAAQAGRMLSRPEQEAFRQIAQALGARYDGPDPASLPMSVTPSYSQMRSAPFPATPASAAPARPAEETAAPTPGAAALDAAVLERLPVALAILKGGEAVRVNRAFLDLFGYGDKAALDAAGGISAVLADEAEDGEGERCARRADGEKLCVDTTLHAIQYEGRPASMLVFTGRAEAKAAAAAEARTPPEARPDAQDAVEAGRRIGELEAILDTATDGILIVDGEARVTGCNRSAEALFGRERADIVGRRLIDLMAPESHRSALDYLDGIARNGVASVLNDGREVIGAAARGGYIPLFMTMGRVGAGKFCAVLRDITHWKKVEDELSSARRQAENASSQKSEFLARISHEIRTPLNAIIGFSEVMMDERFGPVGNDRYKEYLRDIRMSGTHIMSLVNDLLDLSKIEAGKLDLAFEAVAVNDILRDCVALMQPQANRERIIIRTSLSSSLPPVVADARSLRQIVLNLLSNAIKFTPQAGQVIVSSIYESNGEVAVRVRDTGSGMSAGDIQKALEPFRQLQTARSSRGTGLGLPLTKALVEANRAHFRIESTVGQGTLVEVTFPSTRVLAE